MADQTAGEGFVMGGSEGPINFSTFILGLASTALIHLGDAPNPESGKLESNLDLAKQSLDLLDLLRSKTKGNLSQDEEKLFASLLTDLKLRFVKHSSAKA